MDDGKKGTFGRGLQKFISSNLPYRSPASIIDDVTQDNPKFKSFYKAGSVRKELLAQHSIIAPKVPESSQPVGSFLADRAYNELMYATLDVDKYRRLRDYRVMAQFAEVADALDEICDEFLNEDDHGRMIDLKLRNDKEFDPLISKQMRDEFYKFINLFDFKERAWEYIRSLLVDGELYFENIIHDKHIEEGILGVINVPTQAIDPVYDNFQNMHIKAYLLRKAKHHKDADEQNYSGLQDKDFIPLEKNQVTYVNSGTWNENRTFRIPFIENARRAYRQLSLIEDSIIIYRLVRAPERLVFNVDVGQMSPPKAEGYIRKLMQNYWSKKSFSLDGDNRVNSFNPQSILDAYWFPKREGSTGTEVTTLPGGQNLGELQDLNYFVKKLYKALKVPTNRVETESSQYSADANVLREELKFANFVVRLQSQFASGIKDAFITHLKLKKLWSQFELRENSFDLMFTPPRNYFELRKQQILDLKANSFNTMTQNESISKQYSQKEYLGWTDEQIKANREWLRKDAALQHEIEQIRGGGADWAAGGGGPGADAGAAPGAPAGDVPPDMGPTGGDDVPDSDIPEPTPTPGGETSALPT